MATGQDVVEFLKGEEFSQIVQEAIRKATGHLARKLEGLENELATLRCVNTTLIKKLNVDNSELASMMSEMTVESASDEESKGERFSGVVKWFNVIEGFGFIAIKDSNEEAFVHRSAIIKMNPNKEGLSLEDGEYVEFNIKHTKKGKEATRVTGPNGEAVQGSSRQNPSRGGHSRTFRTRNHHSSRQSLNQDNDSHKEHSRPNSRQYYQRDRNEVSPKAPPMVYPDSYVYHQPYPYVFPQNSGPYYNYHVPPPN